MAAALISYLDVAKERFIKNFGCDEKEFVEENFSLKLIYRMICNYFISEIISNYSSYKVASRIPKFIVIVYEEMFIAIN